MPPVTGATTGRSTLASIYCSDIAYWAALVVIWELLVILIALWVGPVVLAAASATSALPPADRVIGAGA